MIRKTLPDSTEAAEYHFTYIHQVGKGDICDILEAQRSETISLRRNSRKTVGAAIRSGKVEHPTGSEPYVSYLGSPLSHLVRATLGSPSSRQSRTWKSIA